MLKKCLAEGIGTFALVLFGCGVAVATSTYAPEAFWVATSLAFGLSIVAMAYCIGKISGCHVNPAVSLAMAINKKITWKEFGLYCLSQVVGAALASAVLGLCFGDFSSLGANQMQLTASGEAFPLYVGVIVEVVLTFLFILAIFGATHKNEEGPVAGLVIGGTLTLVHLLGLVFTGTSVNPARSLMPAIFQAFASNTTAISQVWIFILAPFAGAALAALVWKLFTKETEPQKAEIKE